ncbi:hypothetical protein GGP41_004766 [Bipolaris sorokiniana]|uniref:Uncharacterized protein n=2 Tax=Cochliobolus sativus TaxID=45130 RepID=A0A8H5ZDJ2_COCSA|nr:uncharacterized protein COCSADRAFT_177022 [Bipolaris sorokiniana ND90Pr]EMD69222.1 hypothetical protein COCSADRAFT_177022 [Bipolaris sorokiniana ND90Pr]KAF5846729.1 hypothetical protein GGP41_004766 [Bipolaris sorokiniana]
MSMISQTLQGAALSVTSNVLAQAISSYKDDTPFALNYQSVLKFVVFSVLSTPPNIIWQGFLEDQFPTNVPSTPASASSEKSTSKSAPTKTSMSRRNVLIKFILDQTIGAVVNTLMFVSYMAYVNAQGKPGVNVSDVVTSDCINKTWPMMKDGYKFWPAISLISFLWIPVDKRIVFGASVGVVWGIYLSLAANA